MCVVIYIFSNTVSHMTTHQMWNDAIYKMKLEFKNPSISAHFDILQMHFYP